MRFSILGVAALVLVLTFGAFANAAGMVGPVIEAQDRLRNLLGNPPQLLVATAFYFLALILLPLAPRVRLHRLMIR